MGAEGTFSSEDIDNLKTSQEFKCTICGCDLNETGYHIDHKIALTKGGTNWPSNLQLLCPFDNIRKYNLTTEEYKKKYNLE